ncbi:hypothetical protein HPP92_028230 [Vanilla planifolia]|uniref:RING-type domain-containing protein n=1 Tax=Vanilla planifolia TaxID=51239 RepID=A0A835U438_VANPL|nr:hypothetical protein HPP92_028228 [Vanilla planifolia]KAG0447639.1 hypothetical protein HPP92_028230 [Vanilla planifolia]
MEPVNVASPPSKWAPFNGASDFGKDMAIAFAALSCAVSLAFAVSALVRHLLRRHRRSRQLFSASASDLEKPTAARDATPPSEELSVILFSAQEGLHGSAAKAADCVICLVDFTDGVPIRVLPNCGHAFHVACIDPWTNSRRTCPTCRLSSLPVETASSEKCTF